ncbi:hypothetical protein DFA_09054 [Cavenderia fasciculata]|uniref:BRCT domain-containing protein n=1 Tax=Cavenderia fasciculata TaxID=261658 RepID=F4Q6K6_CACFS|nr:uncharacterized protein DFA_09054 [Cavenderia fasciculata]EGG16516.1 hypothetical protein DFA_09054 [Cavenderia fasciculata]|eukprot:XP_004354916.1 hypothetical protein DFA_09054 [Cavenderia fasciculata]
MVFTKKQTLVSTLYQDCIFYLDLGTTASFQQKNDISKFIKDNGGTVSISFSAAKTTHFITTKESINTFKTKLAYKSSICSPATDILPNQDDIIKSIQTHYFILNDLLDQIKNGTLSTKQQKEEETITKKVIEPIVIAEPKVIIVNEPTTIISPPITIASPSISSKSSYASKFLELQQMKRDFGEKKKVSQLELINQKKAERQAILDNKAKEKEEKLKEANLEKQKKIELEKQRRKSTISSLSFTKSKSSSIPSSSSSFTSSSSFSYSSIVQQSQPQQQQQIKSKPFISLEEKEKKESRIKAREEKIVQLRKEKIQKKQDEMDQAKLEKKLAKDQKRVEYHEAVRVQKEKEQEEKEIATQASLQAYLLRCQKRKEKEQALLEGGFVSSKSKEELEREKMDAESRKIFVGGITFDDLVGRVAPSAMKKIKEKRVSFLLQSFNQFGKIDKRIVDVFKGHFHIVYADVNDAIKAVKHYQDVANKTKTVQEIKDHLKSLKLDLAITPTVRFYVKPTKTHIVNNPNLISQYQLPDAEIISSTINLSKIKPKPPIVFTCQERPKDETEMNQDHLDETIVLSDEIEEEEEEVQIPEDDVENTQDQEVDGISESDGNSDDDISDESEKEEEDYSEEDDD